MTEKITTVSYADRILPNQDFGSHLYTGKDPFMDRIFSVLTSYAEPDRLPKDRFEQPGRVGFEEMTTPPNQLAFFQMLLTISSARRILEIGTFIGRSSTEFALMLGNGGHVTTIEAFDEFADIAERNLAKNGVAEQVTLLRGNARQVLEKLSGPYDFVFVDGSKQDYLDFTLRAIELLSPAGMIVVDDIFFHGDAVNDEPSTIKGKGCKETLEYFRNYPHCRKAIIPAWNGTLLLYGFDQGR